MSNVNDKSLIKKNDTVWTKVVLFFKNIFRNAKESNNVFLRDNAIPYVEEYKYKPAPNFDAAKEKERFFEIYNNVRVGKIKLEDLDVIDLIKVNSMLKEEEKLKREKVGE